MSQDGSSLWGTNQVISGLELSALPYHLPISGEGREGLEVESLLSMDNDLINHIYPLTSIKIS